MEFLEYWKCGAEGKGGKFLRRRREREERGRGEGAVGVENCVGEGGSGGMARLSFSIRGRRRGEWKTSQSNSRNAESCTTYL